MSGMTRLPSSVEVTSYPCSFSTQARVPRSAGSSSATRMRALGIQQRLEPRPLDVAAAEDRHRVAARRDAPVEQRRHGDRAARLGDQLARGPAGAASRDTIAASSTVTTSSRNAS